jgi:hypothetical protein
LWRRGAPPPDLQEETLFGNARSVARLDDFGIEPVLPALRAYLAAARREANLTPLGRTMTHGQAVLALVARARTIQLMRRNPAWAERPLAPPVVIAGPMRSGTTRLHRLMALHPGLAHLKLYEATFPVPPPRWSPDWRPRAMAGLLALARRSNPMTLAIHPMSPREPDEELGLFETAFWGAILEAQRPIPSYARWCEAADARPAYQWLATLLRMIGGARGDDPARPWLLKTPQHMANLPTLVETFPGARVIMTQRDPVAVVASSASLAWHNMVLQTDVLDPHWVGREWLWKTKDRMRKAAAFRAAAPPGTVLDVGFEEGTRDPLGVLARALTFAGLDFPASVRAAAEAWLAREAAQPRHAAHRYDLGDFGLSAEEVRAELAGLL